MLNYIFGGRTGINSPQELARRREQQRAIQARSAGRLPQDPWDGLNAIASAISGRVENNRLDEAESRGKAAGESAYAPIAQALAGKGTPDIGTLTGALSNEWLNPGQRSIAQSLLQQHLLTTDPMYGLRKRKAELEVGNLESPKPKYHNKGLDVGAVVRANGLGGSVAR